MEDFQLTRFCLPPLCSFLYHCMQPDRIKEMAFSFPHLLFSFFLVLPIFAFAQTGGKVAVGSSLFATEASTPWLSPSGDFAFGFQVLGNNKDLFLLSIWYNKIPDKTIVWYANGDQPAPRGSKLQLSADGLVLNSPQGDNFWSSETTNGVVAFGLMNDTGNFELLSSDSSKLWESFKTPADTLLPSQTLDRGVKLSSRLTETNFARGRFQLVLQGDGNLVLASINLPSDHADSPYYQSGTTADSNSSPGFQVVFNESGYLFVLRENGETFPLTPRVTASGKDFYHRATLNFDGLFTQYYHPKNSTGKESWTAFWFEPDNICTANTVDSGSGTCGFNSYCSLNTDRRPICKCPKGYSLVDPNDPYGSCNPNFTQSCQEDEPGPVEDLYDFVVLTDIDWPLADYALLEPFTEEKCRNSCLHDCMCSVAIFRAGDKCWKKKLPLSNGRVDPSLNGAHALLKVRKGNPPPFGFDPHFSNEGRKKKNQDTLITVESVLLGSSLLINCILGAALCFGFYFIYQKKLKTIPQGESAVETNLRCFTYKELVDATNGFKEELGRGAFGIVYKGVLQLSSSTLDVAVKRLTNVVQDSVKEFKTEVNVIGQTHHKNLVKLLGFCDDGQAQRLLVYECLSNGTLASFLFGDSRPCWSQRTEIAVGIARGLLYLHEECSTQIIHCDIKPQNILLDEYYSAKISDFGLAKLLLLNQSKTHTAIRGTRGYVAPDWFRNMPITVKVDVYSFGVLLLEIICCRKSVDVESGAEERAILTDWAYDCFFEGAFDALVENDMEALNEKEKVERFVKVAIWCIQEDPSLRPTMRKVTQMLEGVVEVPVPPCPWPAYYNTSTI